MEPVYDSEEGLEPGFALQCIDASKNADGMANNADHDQTAP